MNDNTTRIRRRPVVLILLAVTSFVATSITFNLLLSLETSLLSKSLLSMQKDYTNYDDLRIKHQPNSHQDLTVDDTTTRRRRLVSMTEQEVTEHKKTKKDNAAIIGQSTTKQAVILNMLRRARDKVDEKDVPFLLQVPYTNSDVVYNIMTECYGLVGREYWDVEELKRDEKEGVVDQFYVSSHDRPKEVS